MLPSTGGMLPQSRTVLPSKTFVAIDQSNIRQHRIKIHVLCQASLELFICNRLVCFYAQYRTVFAIRKLF